MSKIALVHDYFIQMGGAEKVAEELQTLFPDSPMFTTVDQRNGSATPLQKSMAKSSWMQKLPINKRNHRHYFMLYPLAVESLDLSEYDLIISSTSGYAKGVHKKKGAIHICYCHTPMRWVWRYEAYAEREEFGGLKKAVLPILLKGLKRWDLRAAKQPDYYIANSEVVARRIKECYGREAVVIPPPIDVKRFTYDEPDGDYYLILSRLAPYKRLDLAIKACEKLDRPLVVIGDGVDREQLEKIAGPKTKFLGRQPDEVVNKYASRCRALIFPGEEDFGMTPLEINASGRPVIAFRGGGATETVIENETGVFFNEQTTESVIEAIENFESRSWDRQILRNHAEKFDRAVFNQRILKFLGEVAALNYSPEMVRPSAVPATRVREPFSQRS
jgi:glycosyltransferase involved in cell wall biosynthesis